MGTYGPETTEGDSAKENLRTVRLHYAAYARGDLATVVAGLDDQILITVYDEHGKSVRTPVRGREGARAFFEGIKTSVADLKVDIENLRADGDRVLAQVSLAGTVRKTGASGAIPAVHLFTIHEGLITEIRTHRPDWQNYEPEIDGS